MLAQLTLFPSLPKTLNATHLLVLLPKTKTLPKDVPHGEMLAAVLKRRDMKADELAKSAVAANAANGTLVVWAMLDFEKDTFAQQTQVRKALQLLLDEHPKAISISVSGDAVQRRRMAELAVYGAWVNGALLPVHKKKDERKPLQKIELYGFNDKKVFEALKAQAAGNLLCRELTVLPPNELTPGAYRQRIKKLALANGWKHEEFDHEGAAQDGRGCIRCGGAGQRPGRRGHRASHLQTPEGQTDRGAGGQGHLLRYRWSQPQTVALHAQHARGHERFGGVARHSARGVSSRNCR